ncbi:MAG: YccF domain-containing protein [Chloroflexi bacterium]|nr:YccF domain-containing protein [Chloroflexota bacterium]
MNTTVVNTRQNPGCLLQILWFAFIGWWLGQLWIVIAWILMVSIVGIPLGVMMLNVLPRVIALRGETRQVSVTTRPDGTIVQRELPETQVNILVRAIYFIFVGWWLSAIWMEAAYALCLTIIGLPIGFLMFDLVPAVVSLKRT